MSKKQPHIDSEKAKAAQKIAEDAGFVAKTPAADDPFAEPPAEVLAFEPVALKVKRLNDEAKLPQRATPGSAAYDVSCIDSAAIAPGMSATVSTGLAFEIPEGHVMLAFSRSGHGFKHGIRLANCVGVIDSDYRGELFARLHNDGRQVMRVDPGNRVLQVVVLKLPEVEVVEVDELGASERGENGLGSTGA